MTEKYLSAVILTAVTIKQHFLTPLLLIMPLLMENMSDEELKMAKEET